MLLEAHRSSNCLCAEQEELMRNQGGEITSRLRPLTFPDQPSQRAFRCLLGTVSAAGETGRTQVVQMMRSI